MQIFLSFTVVGLVAGCVYALIATGLVVTYNTTGIFNFAHGAIAMFGAYTYWQFTNTDQGWGWPAPVALFVVLFVLAPVFGLVIERLLMRPLRGASVDLTLVVTLGLLLFLVGLAQVIWNPNQVRNLPSFFNGSGFRLGYVQVSWHEVAAILATVGIAIGLRLLFNNTRTGIAMRAVVDSPDLLAMAGGRPIRIQQLAWMLSCSIAALAGILLFVAWNMGEWREFARLRHFSMFYRAILVSTLLLTVIFDLTVAVETGLVLSSLFFIYRISSITKVEPIALPPGRERLSDGRRVGAWRLFGSIFFGSVTKLEALLEPGNPLPDVVILDMHQVINLDTTGLDALEALYKHLAKRGARLVLVDPNEQPLSLLKRSGFLAEIGETCVFKTIEEALAAE